MPPVAVGASETVPRPPGQVTVAAGGRASGLSSARRKTSAGKARRRSASPPGVSWSCSLWPARPTPPQLPGDTRLRGLGPPPGGFPCPPVILACPALPHFLLENPPGPQDAPPTVSWFHQGARLTEAVGRRTAAADGAQPTDQDLIRGLSAALSPPLVPAAGSLPLTRWLMPPP